MTAEKNKKRIISLLCFLIIIFFSTYGNRGSAGENIFGYMHLPEVKNFSLNNGIKIYYIKDELPKLNIVASIGFGKLYEKKENAGTSELMAKTLSISGSKKYPGNRLNEEIESIGGEFSIATSWENTEISIKVLARHREKAFDIISDLLNNPLFDEKYINIAKSLIIEQIKRKMDSPDTVAFEKVREIIFSGDGYGAVPGEEAIKSISRQHLEDAWKKYCKGGNILIGISSPEDFSKISVTAEKFFSGLIKGEREGYNVDAAKAESVVRDNKSKIYLVPMNIPQTTIVIGTVAPDINYTGKYSLKIMNYIFGGGSFNSRLMNEIRVKKGLAYAVQSVIRFKHRTGVFIGFAQTKLSSSEEVLSIMLENINSMANAPVTEDELNWAKKSIYNSYIFMFDTIKNLIGNYMNIDFYGLPEDYYKNYPVHINSVTKEDILNEGGRLFKNGLIKVVVGSPELKERLNKFGEVIILDK